MSKIEELQRKIRNHPIYEHLIPLESTLSLPVPLARDGYIYLRFLVYQIGHVPKGQPRPIYRPVVRLTVEYPSGRFVEYSDLSFVEDAPRNPEGEQIGYALASSLDYDQVIAKRAALLAALEQLIHTITEPGWASQDSTTNWQELWYDLVEPALQPYYQALNPSLFQVTN